MAEIIAEVLSCKLMYDCGQIAPGVLSMPSALQCKRNEERFHVRILLACLSCVLSGLQSSHVNVQYMTKMVHICCYSVKYCVFKSSFFKEGLLVNT